MSKSIDIEYCGSWGYGGPATQLKNSIAQSIPNAQISVHSAGAKTGTIKVSVVEAGNRNVVWNKGRGETVSGHAEIIAALKQAGFWAKRRQLRSKAIMKWKMTLKLSESSQQIWLYIFMNHNKLNNRLRWKNIYPLSCLLFAWHFYFQIFPYAKTTQFSVW